jgi:hypothetical protein
MQHPVTRCADTTASDETGKWPRQKHDPPSSPSMAAGWGIALIGVSQIDALRLVRAASPGHFTTPPPAPSHLPCSTCGDNTRKGSRQLPRTAGHLR